MEKFTETRVGILILYKKKGAQRRRTYGGLKAATCLSTTKGRQSVSFNAHAKTVFAWLNQLRHISFPL
jgi:hypothetical protein